ncbi:MAG: hypothetical protein ACLP6E_19710 [Acidimicrobiales bacterium]
MAIQTLPATAPGLSGSGEEDESGPDTSAKRVRKHRSKLRWAGIAAGVVLCALVLVCAIAVGVMMFLARDTASPYKVGQALQQFRQLQLRNDVVSDVASSKLPTTGVYTYTTSGSESASAPGLPASTLGYPETTTMTVFSDACGEDWRWQPLTNRYEDLVVCRSPGNSIMLQSRFDTEEFYGATDSRNFVCTPGSILLPVGARPGDRVSGTCKNGGNSNSGGLSISYKGEVVADDVLQVDGVGVHTTHLVLTEKMTGDTVGTGTESLWLDSATGLPVKEFRTENTRSQSAVGWVPSSETFSLELASTSPTR